MRHLFLAFVVSSITLSVACSSGDTEGDNEARHEPSGDGGRDAAETCGASLYSAKPLPGGGCADAVYRVFTGGTDSNSFVLNVAAKSMCDSSAGPLGPYVQIHVPGGDAKLGERTHRVGDGATGFAFEPKADKCAIVDSLRSGEVVLTKEGDNLYSVRVRAQWRNSGESLELDIPASTQCSDASRSFVASRCSPL